MWVNAKLSVGSSLKTTPSHNEENECNDTFLVRGIIDRIDMEQFLTDNTETTIGLRIIDYKVMYVSRVCACLMLTNIPTTIFFTFLFEVWESAPV
mmetsp:Transcript_38057/g.38411  ORF Transcript_38057/g.38411 Transcript_38057/m.38411 type:complete len:95 (-) Transcript_38057:467-751(-)